MTAGRFFLPPPPMEGSKLTHQTSHRFMIHILEGILCPFRSFLFPLPVLGHFSVVRLEVRAHYVWADYFLYKSAYFSGTDGLVEPLINLFINGYGQFLLHGIPPIHV